MSDFVPALRVLAPGVQTMLVDRGRPRSRSLGVAVGGAADGFSLALGNALVGNPPDTVALEIALAGPTLEALVPLGCVLFGAPFEMASDRQTLRPGTTFTLEPGERLRLGGTPSRMRAYLCIRGGIDGPVILESRTALSPLGAGAVLRCRPGKIHARFVRLPASSLPALRYLPGAQAEWFPPDVLVGKVFEVTRATNRMGLRLRGEPLTLSPREMVSEPVCPGTVQVTRDGQLIVLGVDGQTIGGYPRVAQVIAADLDRLGQLRPGEVVVFEPVSLEAAESLGRIRRAMVRDWVGRLRASGPA